MVEVTEYQFRWPQEFKVLADGLRSALGLRALRIDHIGSTSVPGLVAKDIIDIQVTVAELSDEIVKRIESIGHVHRPHVDSDHLPPDMEADPAQWRKLYFREADGHREVHIHVRVDGRLNQRYPLLFRDYLRQHPPAAAAYGEFKRRLGSVVEEGAVYADTKDPVCDLIIIAAEVWSSRTGWAPGPSDA